MVNDPVERVRTALLPLCEPLHDTFAWAEQVRRNRLPELADSPQYAWLGTHTIRAFTHLRLTGPLASELGDWRVSGNHAQNGALWLTNGTYRVRLLHAVNDHDAPPPGSNATRKAYYRNLPLALFPLFGPANDRLLLIWRIDPRTGAPTIRVVRPIGDWKWGARQQTDLDFLLPDTSDDLAGLEFTPSDEDLDLNMPADDEKEEGDGSVGGLSG